MLPKRPPIEAARPSGKMVLARAHGAPMAAIRVLKGQQRTVSSDPDAAISSHSPFHPAAAHRRGRPYHRRNGAIGAVSGMAPCREETDVSGHSPSNLRIASVSQPDVRRRRECDRVHSEALKDGPAWSDANSSSRQRCQRRRSSPERSPIGSSIISANWILSLRK